MKTVLSMALGLTLCVASDVRCQVQSQSLSERVLLLTGGTWNSNLIAISSREGLVVVDTYDTPEATAEALAKAQKHFSGERVRFLINTHGHDDHVWGNELFEGVPIIAHRHTRRYMADRQRELVPFFSGQRIRDLESQLDDEQGRSDEETADLRERLASARTAHAKWGAVKITLPTIAVEDSVKLHLGERRIEILHLGAAHSEGDLVVFLPEERILMVGDLVGRQRSLLRLDGVQGDVVGWLSTLRELHARYAQNVSAVVSGHGQAGGLESLEATRDYLSYLVTEVTAAQRRGWNLEKAKETLVLEGLRSFEDFDELRENNIEATWQSLRRRRP